jgi:hypothetical protein
MQRRSQMKSGVLVVLILLLTVSACDNLPFGFTKISDIIKNPARFDNKEVKIQGKVVSVTKIPFLAFRFYTLDDDSGQITVSTESDVPAADTRVTVRVRISSMMIIDSRAVGLRAAEVKRL